MKTALVISGGGAKGAFAAGVVKYIYEAYHDDGWFEIIGGTSTGALITPIAGVLKEPALAESALETLINCYTTVHTKDILDKRCIMSLIFKPDALYGTKPLRKIIKNNLTPERFAYLQSDDAPYCYVVYADYKTGQAYVVSPKDRVPNENGSGDRPINIKEFRQAVLASASVPVIMECTKINNNVCYDGGVRELLPLRQAIDNGAQKILPVFLDPETFGVSESKFNRLDQTLFRTLDILVNETLLNDVERAELINYAVDTKDKLKQEFSGDPSVWQKIEQVLNAYPDLFGGDRRLIDIVKGIRPDHQLTDDSLKFDPEQMTDWLNQGYSKAQSVITSSPF
ncbi:MAG: patatin-like phospholipase family protein [Spirochaetales bacterium]|nr:patatin-like phospholipase family protein [Spirochaetales bacterium]